MKLVYQEITKETLADYQSLILPMVYEELQEQEDMNTEYICMCLFNPLILNIVLS